MSHISISHRHGLSAMARLPHDTIEFNRDLGLYSSGDDESRLDELRRTAIIDAFLNEMNDDDERDWLEDAA